MENLLRPTLAARQHRCTVGPMAVLHFLALAALVVSASGCTVLFSHKSESDAEPGDKSDAEPGNEFFPPLLVEGIGAAPSSTGQPLVVRGQFSGDDAVRCELANCGAAACPEVICRALDIGSNAAAMEVRMPVLPGLPTQAQTTATLLVHVGDITAAVPVQGLEELTVGDASVTTCLEPPTAIDTLPAPDTLYSEIHVEGCAWQVEAGTPGVGQRLELRATAGIVVDGSLSASAWGSQAGIGGCAGAAAERAASCEPLEGGGSGTTFGPTGGGGGNHTSGGEGPLDEPGGMVIASSAMVPLTGGGGGGGGQGTLGGGGGGIIILDSQGPIEFTSNALLSAQGSTVSIKSGSGGAGGSILVRTATGIQASNSAALELRGSEGFNGFGDGGDGRLRIDSPAQSRPMLAGGLGNSPVVRGPMFVGLPAVHSQDSTLPIQVRGMDPGLGLAYLLELNGTTTPLANFIDQGEDDLGLISGEVSLVPGINRLCLYSRPLAPAASLESEPTTTEARYCQSIAWVGAALP